MTPPDSDEREVIVVRAPAAHCDGCGTPMVAEEIHCDDCADDMREDEVSQNGTTDLVGVPLPLAQRILAALESVAVRTPNLTWSDLAAELRERMPK